jgi:excisionase family DNA binding protein
MSDQPNLYTLAEAAELTGLSVEALRLRIKRGKIEGLRFNDGLRVRLTQADIDAIRRQRASQQIPTLTNDWANEARALLELVGALREQAEKAQTLADQRGDESAELRERVGRAEGEATALRDRVSQAEQRMAQSEAREAAERARADRLEAERDAIRAEFGAWTSGGPLARAWRAFVNRQR